MKNIPVPPYTAAPPSHRWLWSIGPAALLTFLYRLLPARWLWNPRRTASSHLAMAAILSGGGWSSFAYFARPHLKDGIPFWLDGDSG